MSTKILLLAGDGDSTSIVYNHLAGRFGPMPAIIEAAASKKAMLRTRARKVGLPATLSQLAFIAVSRLVLSRMARARINAIVREHGLDLTPPADPIRVASVNAAETVQHIKRFNPKVIVVNGTRIIARHVLEATPAVFLNTHVGITPQYRGAHGGYWARLNGDPENCGVTVHVVDPGIDTGPVVAQARIAPTSDDSFLTYPYLQIAAALPLLLSAVEDALNDSLSTHVPKGASGVHYHPGLFQYVAGILRGVW